MKINFSHPLVWFAIGISFIIFINFFVSSFNNVDKELNLAASSYKKAELASTIAEREDGFNQSLSVYKRFETDYSPTLGSGKLYYNIANNYFQLGQYPLAVVYYLRAEALMPGNEKVTTNLEITFDKLGIKRIKTVSIFDKIFFFQNRLSTPEKLQILFVLSTLLFILGSCFIWYPFHGLKTITFIAGFLFSILLLSLFYTQYISPSTGVILKANELFQDAGYQYTRVLKEPIPAGSEVTILDVRGDWIKIQTADGNIGFIPYDSIQIV